MEKKILEKNDKMKIDPHRDSVTICFLHPEHHRYATNCAKLADSYY